MAKFPFLIKKISKKPNFNDLICLIWFKMAALE